mgnify:CR=1 FL=1
MNNIVNKSVEGLLIVKIFILLLNVSLYISGNLNSFFNREGSGKLFLFFIFLFYNVNENEVCVINILKH